MPKQQRLLHQGFNLIEAAVVLSVVGLVIGSIWVAAATVTREQRITETALGIIYTVEQSKRLLPIYSYPTVNGQNTYIGNTIHAAGTYPSGWQRNGGQSVSPLGVNIEVLQGCWVPECPTLGVIVRGPGDSLYKSTLTAIECTKLIRQTLNYIQKRQDFRYFQIQQPSAPTNQAFYPPISPDTISCPDNFSRVIFWFGPQ